MSQDTRTKEPGNATDVLERMVTVCDRCLQASCWQGIFMCQEAQTAGTREVSVAQLALLRAEAPDYWFRDPSSGTIDHDAVRGVYVFDENALYDFIEASDMPDLRNTISPPVMNSPADEAEARDRANGAPGQADRDAASRGESGLTSRPEARPVTPTEQLTSNERLVRRLRQCRADGQLVNPDGDEAALTLLGLQREVERLSLEFRLSSQQASGLRDDRDRLRAALELRETGLRLIAAGPPITMANDGVAAWAAFVAQEALSGEHSVPETTASPQAPIVKVVIENGKAAYTTIYAPGLPDGTHDLYCEPEAVAPMMRSAEKAKEVQS